MPQLMETCIRNNLHEEGLVLLRHANTLYSEHLYLHTLFHNQPHIIRFASFSQRRQHHLRHFQRYGRSRRAARIPAAPRARNRHHRIALHADFVVFGAKHRSGFHFSTFLNARRDSTPRPNPPMKPEKPEKPEKPGKPKKGRMWDRRGKTAGK